MGHAKRDGTDSSATVQERASGTVPVKEVSAIFSHVCVISFTEGKKTKQQLSNHEGSFMSVLIKNCDMWLLNNM